MDSASWDVRSEKETNEIVKESKLVLPILSDEKRLQKKSELLKALGDDTRLKIIGMLCVSDLCMCEIVSGLNAASSTISHHLKLLERGDVITSRREGKFTIFSLNKEILSYLD